MFSNKFEEIIKATNPQDYIKIFGESYAEQIFIDQINIRKSSIDLDFFAPLKEMNIPEKWKRKGYDHFRFRIYLIKTSNVSMENLPADGPVNFMIRDQELKILSNSHCRIEFSYQKIFLSNIEGYKEGNE
ncbi:hypothetical protein [Pseudomonas rhizoryzae]|uniref:hypothetical protein n=1 Tax=Pseudomonas rhizoryzae TaxID=2571129 RepID=UPI000A9BE90B|nr:hypothetical protein [Pseudomonas rhizoryzae]